MPPFFSKTNKFFVKKYEEDKSKITVEEERKYRNPFILFLIDNGKLIFKTDNEPLFIDSLEYLKESPFELVSSTFNYLGDDDFDAPTEYEKKFRTLGTPIKRYIAKLKND